MVIASKGTMERMAEVAGSATAAFRPTIEPASISPLSYCQYQSLRVELQEAANTKAMDKKVALASWQHIELLRRPSWVGLSSDY